MNLSTIREELDEIAALRDELDELRASIDNLEDRFDGIQQDPEQEV